MPSFTSKGIAVGCADIRNDTVIYRYFDEDIRVSDEQGLSPGFAGHGYNGYFYTAPVSMNCASSKAEAADTA
jgi:hypothetical protein